MSVAAAILLALDGSAVPPESPWVGYSVVYGEQGPSEAGVLDARTGRVLWSERYDSYVWVRAWDPLLLVSHSRAADRQGCRAFVMRTGEPRFRAPGRLWETVSRGGRPLLVFQADGLLSALDPATDVEAWRIPLAQNAWPRLAPGGGRIVVRGQESILGYAVDDGRLVWEVPRGPTDQFSLAAGRLWLYGGGTLRTSTYDLADGRPREAPALAGVLVSVVEQGDAVDLVYDRRVVRLRAPDLARAWTAELPELVSYGHGDARTLYLDARASSKLFLLDAPTGRLLASETLEVLRQGGSRSNLNHPRYFIKAIHPRGEPMSLRLFDRADGRILWRGKVDDYEEGWTGDSFLVKSGETLRRLDLPTGEERWSAPIEGRWEDTERRGGRILIGTTRSISALDVATGRRPWSMTFPKGAHDVTLTTLPRR